MHHAHLLGRKRTHIKFKLQLLHNRPLLSSLSSLVTLSTLAAGRRRRRRCRLAPRRSRCPLRTLAGRRRRHTRGAACHRRRSSCPCDRARSRHSRSPAGTAACGGAGSGRPGRCGDGCAVGSDDGAGGGCAAVGRDGGAGRVVVDAGVVIVVGGRVGVVVVVGGRLAVARRVVAGRPRGRAFRGIRGRRRRPRGAPPARVGLGGGLVAVGLEEIVVLVVLAHPRLLHHTRALADDVLHHLLHLLLELVRSRDVLEHGVRVLLQALVPLRQPDPHRLLRRRGVLDHLLQLADGRLRVLQLALHQRRLGHHAAVVRQLVHRLLLLPPQLLRTLLVLLRGVPAHGHDVPRQLLEHLELLHDRFADQLVERLQRAQQAAALPEGDEVADGRLLAAEAGHEDVEEGKHVEGEPHVALREKPCEGRVRQLVFDHLHRRLVDERRPLLLRSHRHNQNLKHLLRHVRPPLQQVEHPVHQRDPFGERVDRVLQGQQRVHKTQQLSLLVALHEREAAAHHLQSVVAQEVLREGHVLPRLLPQLEDEGDEAALVGVFAQLRLRCLLVAHLFEDQHRLRRILLGPLRAALPERQRLLDARHLLPGTQTTGPSSFPLNEVQIL
eukprot:Rhum_TRINITY_DN14426_c9_g1::Rhum_TRINITY_DN14426_c9_g1_i1::g.87211::m.87211